MQYPPPPPVPSDVDPATLAAYPLEELAGAQQAELLVSGITKKSPKPNENYMAKGVRWKIKK